MSTDREILENAARANGMEVLPRGRWPRDPKGWFYNDAGGHDGMYDVERPVKPWNPRDNSADALELAVKLGMKVDARYRQPEALRYNSVMYWVEGSTAGRIIEFGDLHTDPLAATRLAITRAAASIQLAKIAGEDRHE